MDIRIRNSEKTDIPLIYRMILEFAIFQQTPEKVKVTTDQMYDNADAFRCFVAENDNGDLIGYACYYYAYYSWTGKVLYLDDLYVKEAYRGKGVGQSFLNALIEEAKSSGCKKMRWQVSRWNEKAIRFYKHIGAAIDDVEMNCDLVF